MPATWKPQVAQVPSDDMKRTFCFYVLDMRAPFADTKWTPLNEPRDATTKFHGSHPRGMTWSGVPLSTVSPFLIRIMLASFSFRSWPGVLVTASSYSATIMSWLMQSE